MNIVKKIINSIDIYQRSHSFLAFPYAVIKKYGDDEAGNQAALLTYYGFLALFPLLLVITTLVSIFAGHYPGLQQVVQKSLADYFPSLGSQLTSHSQQLHKSGLPLLIGLVFTLYGARGVADAFRNGVSHIWQIPKTARPGFPKAALKSLSLIIVGGVGFLAASVSSGFATSAGHGIIYKVLPLLINVFILFWVFVFLFNTSLPSKVGVRQIRLGALIAAIGLVLLQSVGSLLLARQLKNLDALNSNFAIALGLLFWIYLQAQMVYYAVEISSVKAEGLWPRGLQTDNLTTADKKVYARGVAKERSIDDQAVQSDFRE